MHVSSNKVVPLSSRRVVVSICRMNDNCSFMSSEPERAVRNITQNVAHLSNDQLLTPAKLDSRSDVSVPATSSICGIAKKTEKNAGTSRHSLRSYKTLAAAR